MAKQYSDWREYNEANVKELLTVIKTAGRSVNITELASLAGFDRFHFSRINNGELTWNHISAESYAKLLKRLSDYHGRDFLNSNGPSIISNDVVAMGLSALFGLTDTDLNEAAANFCGVYTSYRYSYRLRQHKAILRGLTEFSLNEDRSAIVSREIYRIQKQKDNVEMFFERQGYLCADKAATLPKLFCKKTDGSNDFQVTYFDDVLPEGHGPHAKRVLEMRGFIIDWQRRQPYAASIYLRRNTDPDISVCKGKYDLEILKAFHESDPEVLSLVPELERNFQLFGKGLAGLQSKN